MRTRQPPSALRYALLALAALLSPAIAPSAGAQEPDGDGDAEGRDTERAEAEA